MKYKQAKQLILLCHLATVAISITTFLLSVRRYLEECERDDA